MKLFGYLFGSNEETARRLPNPITSEQTSSRHPSHTIHRNRPGIIMNDLETDTDTLGNETLYDWSVAAQTVEGAGTTDKVVSRPSIVTPTNPVMVAAPNDNLTTHGGKKKKTTFGFGLSKGDCASSSDDDDDDDEDDDLGGNIGYCQLEDSPSRCSSGVHHDGESGENVMGMDREESTPQRRTGGFLFRRDKHLSPSKSKAEKQMKSPTKIKSRIQRKLKTVSPSKDHQYPSQQLRIQTSEPIDVDSYLPEDGVHIISPPSRLPNTVKDRIHRLKFDSPTTDLSPCEVAENESNTDDSCSFSVRNIGNDNSPLVPTSGFLCPNSFNMNVTCVRPTNTSPPADLNKPLGNPYSISNNDGDHEILNFIDIPIRNNIRTDSDFTFSLHSSDLEGSDGTELLLDGVEMEHDVESFRKQWMSDDPPQKLDEAQENGVAKQFRKNIKKKLLGKVKLKRSPSLESMTPLAENDTPVKHINIFACDKTKNSGRQNLSSSAISLAPLTGLEDIRCNNIGKSQPDADLMMEIDRRKASEKREIERRTLITRQRLEWEKLRKKRLMEAERWRAERKQSKDSATTAGLKENESLELSKNRTLLKTWVQDFNNTYLDENGSRSKSHPHLPNTYELLQSRIDLNRSNLSDTTPHSVVTTRVNNIKKNGALNTYDLNFGFPDDDSAADTPDTTAPMIQDFSCVICKTSDRTHLAVPCMHFSYCSDCVKKIECSDSRCCSVCNKEVENFSRVFL